mmetsp:Transcript_34803/g.74258  ORF Transcript_34803/g.74258 Transcript_34803/m.74258 type:complete len:404 (+) Transcript_34803:139-1350(+)
MLPVPCLSSRQRTQVQPLDLQEDDIKTTPWHGRRGKREDSLRLRLNLATEAGDSLTHMEEGQTGGVYKVPMDGLKSTPLAVFKPIAEEAFERRGVPSGGGAVREEAAYLLDRRAGYSAGVPTTVRAMVPSTALSPHNENEDEAEELVEDGSNKGSVQCFVKNVAGSAEDFGMPRDLARATQIISTIDAQHLAALDIRLCNTDRHAGNLLFQRRKAVSDAHPVAQGAVYKPVPIDHGCALPFWWSMGEANFQAWMEWPQVRAPCLPDVLSTVEAAFKSREEDMKVLADVGLEPAAQVTYRLALALLREGTVRHGLSLACIAGLMCRDPFDPAEPSWLELRIEECSVALGLKWCWTENSYGDRVPAVPEEPTASPPEGFLDRLEEVFRSEETLAAGRRWEEQAAE